MSFYVNTTRHPAIVTLKISGPDDLKVDLKIGSNEVFEKTQASPGYLDIHVRAGEELQLVGKPDEVELTLIAVRSAP